MKTWTHYVGETTEVIELDGELVLPGLIDGHAHMHNLGEELMNLDIYGATSFQQIVDKVAERAKTAQPGEWIFGGRWDQNNWDVKKFPEHDASQCGLSGQSRLPAPGRRQLSIRRIRKRSISPASPKTHPIPPAE